jgi:hypothetical protein
MSENFQMLTGSTIVRKSARHVACEFNGEVVMLQLDKGRYFGLQGVGTAIWNNLEEARSIEEVCDAVAAQFDVDPQVCRNHALKFLTSLQEAGLVDVVN